MVDAIYSATWISSVIRAAKFGSDINLYRFAGYGVVLASRSMYGISWPAGNRKGPRGFGSLGIGLPQRLLRLRSVVLADENRRHIGGERQRAIACQIARYVIDSRLADQKGCCATTAASLDPGFLTSATKSGLPSRA